MPRKGRRGYSQDFRREAVRLLESETKPISQIARDLGINPETLRIWHKQAHGSTPEAAIDKGRSPRGVVASLEEENRRLKRENTRLLEEREILKKATAFFAKDGR
jgi:transposase